MAKKESTFLNMFVTLLVVTAVSSLALAGVYNITLEPIARVKKEKREKAIKEVLPDFDSLAMKDVIPEEAEKPLNLNYARQGEELIGVAIQSYTFKGYSGLIEVMVGFLPDGTINKVAVLTQKETPGLGTKITSDAFKEQFYGKNPASFKVKIKKDGGDVDAITAATISSRAFCDAVNRAYQTFEKEGGGQ